MLDEQQLPHNKTYVVGKSDFRYCFGYKYVKERMNVSNNSFSTSFQQYFNSVPIPHFLECLHRSNIYHCFKALAAFPHIMPGWGFYCYQWAKVYFVSLPPPPPPPPNKTQIKINRCTLVILTLFGTSRDGIKIRNHV